MSHDPATDPSIDPATTNRRDLLKGAAGLAAAATIATIATTATSAAAAPTTAPRGVYAILAGIGEFPASSFTFDGTTAYTFGRTTSAGRPVLGPVVLSKFTDATSPALFRSLVTGGRIATASITVANVDLVVQTSYDFTGVYVSGIDLSGSEDGAVSENVTFVYETITVNQLGAPSVTWSVSANRLL